MRLNNAQRCLGMFFAVTSYQPSIQAFLHGDGRRTLTTPVHQRKVTKRCVSLTPKHGLVEIRNDENVFDIDRPDPNESFVLSEKEVRPVIRVGKDDKEKIINAFGLWCFVATILTCPVWLLAMTVVNVMNKIWPTWDPTRTLYDRTGKWWAKAWLTLTNCYPTYSGDIDRLKSDDHQGSCLYVANHASWLDIPVICTVLDPVFKFIAKGDLRKVPCIGQQLAGGDHILIDRADRRSQLRTYKSGISWLKRGVPVMAFPEGMRSPDGRLMKFKGGLFSMAVKTGVPIVPISVCNTHAIMPANSLFPVQSGAGKLHVHVHEPIVTCGQTEADLSEQVRTAFLSRLPHDQHPLPQSSQIEESSSSLPRPKITINIAEGHDSMTVPAVSDVVAQQDTKQLVETVQ